MEDSTKEFKISSPGGLLEVADFILDHLSEIQENHKNICLVGELGAGKTTFVQILMERLGYEGRVQSPTFVIMKIYDINAYGLKRVVHIDAYRGMNMADPALVNLEAYTHELDTLVIIEWPSMIEGYLMGNDVIITITEDDEMNESDTHRHVKVEGLVA